MNRKVLLGIGIAALLLVLVCGVVAFMNMRQIAVAMLAFTNSSPAYDRGMMGSPRMGGGGMMGGGYGPGMMGSPRMGGGMMGGQYSGQVTPEAPAAAATATPGAKGDTAAPAATATPVPTTAPAAGGRRGMMGGGGQAAGGLVPVSRDGNTLKNSIANLPDGSAAQKIGNWNVTLALSPYPPVSFQKGDFAVTLTDDKGQAITDAQVSLDLTMPGMWMPPSKPNATHVGSGKYQASAMWTMRGQWRIEVIITRGAEKQSAFFDVWL